VSKAETHAHSAPNRTIPLQKKKEKLMRIFDEQLPTNLKAVPSLTEACKSATMLVFCLPHQFIPNICRQLREAKVIGAGAFAVSLTKGVDVSGDKIKIIADVIEEELGISCAALSGANIANEGLSLLTPNPSPFSIQRKKNSFFFRVYE
jgi:glycerol-3-phosphate dehydrogenase (NAD+)